MVKQQDASTKDAGMTTQTKQETYAARIAKLLRHAESTSNQDEAETYIAKAQELMQTWAIDEEMIAKAQGKQTDDKVVEERIAYTGIFQAALFDIGRAVARNNNCRTMISTREAQKAFTTRHGVKVPKKPKRTLLYVIGFQSDVDRVKMLDSSVQIQAGAAMNRWWKAQDTPWMSKMQKFKARREFLFGFARGLEAKLHKAKKEAERQAAQNEAARHGNTEEAAAEAETSVALVLRSRKDQVKDWQDKRYGDSLRSVSRNYSHGGHGASAAGHAAGSNADIGQTGVRGGRKAIG